MKEQRLEILYKIAQGELDPLEADQLLEELHTSQVVTKIDVDDRMVTEGILQNLIPSILPHVSPQFKTAVHKVQTGLSYKTLRNLILQYISMDFVDSLEELGLQLTDDQVSYFALYGIDKHYIQELRELGFSNMIPEDIIRIRVHDLIYDHINQLKELEPISNRFFQTNPSNINDGGI